MMKTPTLKQIHRVNFIFMVISLILVIISTCIVIIKYKLFPDRIVGYIILFQTLCMFIYFLKYWLDIKKKLKEEKTKGEK